MQTVEAFRDTLEPQARAMIDALRAIVAASHDGLAESLKWNAPNYALDGEDRITLGIERKGGVRLVLHRGAQARDPAGFGFDDPAGLAKWPAADRGVATFRSPAEIEARRDDLIDLCRRWIARTRPE